jgi:cardiolipin synthase
MNQLINRGKQDEPTARRQPGSGAPSTWTSESTGASIVENLRLVPNQLTAIRFLAIPVMWVFALRGRLIWLGIGLIVCLLSDLLDGPAARRLNQTSEFGSKFDSISDQLLQLSALIWLILLMPEIFSENIALSFTAITLYLASLVVGLLKFKRVANLHLYLSKVAAFFLFFFVIHAFLFGRYSQGLLLLAGILFILSSTETLLLQLTSSSIDSNTGSILFRYLDKEHPLRIWLARLP